MTDRPIFVVGCPRSGTTLLQLMLHAHPRIAIPPETRFLLTGYQQRGAFGDLREPANRRGLADWITVRGKTRFDELGLDAADVTRQIVAGPPTLGSAFGIVLRAYAQRFGKPRWGDKRPTYVKYLPAVMRLFPDAQVVHLIRDGRDCVASLKEMPWWGKGVDAAIACWTEAVDHGRWARRSLPTGSYHELRYESLIAEPEPELTRLCAFLGEAYDPAMLALHTLADVAVPGRKRWHTATHGPITSARAGSWRDRLGPAEAALCEAVMAGRLREHGYELAGAGRPGPVHLARYRKIAAQRRITIHRRELRDLWQRRADSAPLASLLPAGELAAARP